MRCGCDTRKSYKQSPYTKIPALLRSCRSSAESVSLLILPPLLVQQSTPTHYSHAWRRTSVYKEAFNYLSNQHEISARRLVNCCRDENQVVAETRRRPVILHFKPNSLRDHVFLVFRSFPTTEYTGSDTQCFKCQRRGHIAKKLGRKIAAKYDLVTTPKRTTLHETNPDGRIFVARIRRRTELSRIERQQSLHAGSSKKKGGSSCPT